MPDPGRFRLTEVASWRTSTNTATGARAVPRSRDFFLDLRPRGSGEEKFVCAGTAAELVSGRAALGDDNRQAVLEVLQGGARPLGVEEVLDGLRRRGSR